MKGKQIIVELLKLNPNTSITGKKFKSQNTKKNKQVCRPGSSLKRGFSAIAGAGSGIFECAAEMASPKRKVHNSGKNRRDCFFFRPTPSWLCQIV